MKDIEAVEKVNRKYIDNYNVVSIDVVTVNEDILRNLLNACDSTKHMEECIHWYDDEENPEYNTWIDVEGEGYGWLWLNAEDDETKWHGLLRKSLLDFINSRQKKLSEQDEFVIIVNVKNKVIYHFIERESFMCDTIYTFSDDDLNY